MSTGVPAFSGLFVVEMVCRMGTVVWRSVLHGHCHGVREGVHVRGQVGGSACGGKVFY